MSRCELPKYKYTHPYTGEVVITSFTKKDFARAAEIPYSSSMSIKFVRKYFTKELQQKRIAMWDIYNPPRYSLVEE
jgi:hypothetical protein